MTLFQPKCRLINITSDKKTSLYSKIPTNKTLPYGNYNFSPLTITPITPSPSTTNYFPATPLTTLSIPPGINEQKGTQIYIGPFNQYAGQGYTEKPQINPVSPTIIETPVKENVIVSLDWDGIRGTSLNKEIANSYKLLGSGNS